MNWLAIALVGTAAVWFEYNYQRSRRKKKPSEAGHPAPSATVGESIKVAQPGEQPSISPGSENDTKASTAV